jgi:hypothetical protein
MKKIIFFFTNLFKKYNLYLNYFKYKLRIFSLKLDILIIKIEYIILTNKIIYEILFFYENNKIIKIIFIFYEVILDELKKDYKLLKKNIRKIKLFHRDMNIIFLPFYIFLFLAGILPIIYLIIFLYFVLKYGIKYLLLSLDIYIYNYYEDNNYFIFIYEIIIKYLNNIYIYIYNIYIKIDKFLFRMERKKKLQIKLLNLRGYIWNKYVEIAQKYIDKFDNFILIRFPELWHDFEIYVYNSIIKIYIYKARLIKKIKIVKKKIKEIRILKRILKRKIKIKIKIKKKHLYKFYYKNKRYQIRKLYFNIYKIKYIFIDYINYKKFNIRKFFVINFKLPYLNFIYIFKYNYLLLKSLLRFYKVQIKWHLIMIIHPWFWDYIFYLYIYWFYWDMRAIILYIFPTSPFMHLYFSYLQYDLTPKMWYVVIIMKIKARFYRILRYFIFKPPIFLYKLNRYIIYLIYMKIYVNIIIIFQLIIGWIKYYIYINDLIFKIFLYIRKKYILYHERGFLFFSFKRSVWIDFIILYDLDICFHEYFLSIFFYNKYLYRYPVENMFIYHYYYFIIKPGNFLLLRHYTNKDLPFLGKQLFVDYKCPASGQLFSCYVCPLFYKVTTLHLLSGSYTTNLIVLPNKFLKTPKN